MSDKRYEANIIRATAVEPANNLQSTSAPGVWSIDEVVELQKKEKWPTVGNVITNVENVFSTFLYEGTGAAQNIENGIALGNSFSSGSGSFSGTSANTSTRVNIPTSANFNFGTGDFTIEAFIYLKTSKNYHNVYDQRTPTQDATTNSPIIYIDSNNYIIFYVGGSGRAYSSALSLHTWYHVAVTRASGSTKMFLNGTQQGATYSDSLTYVQPASDFSFGGSLEQNTYNLDGYISNLRVVKGTAIYTSNFTAPTAALTAVSGTSLLAAQGSTPFVDNSGNSVALTLNNSPVASDFGPFTGTGGEGGLVWIKDRDAGFGHNLFDTARGAGKYLNSDDAAAEATDTTRLSSFNNSGFSLGSQGSVNTNNNSLVSWTFRKQAKFFDIVTYTGNGSARTISHNLGSVPGMIILKNLSSGSEGWRVYHRGANGGTNPEQYYAMLQATNAFAAASTPWNNTAPTSTEFTLGTDTGSNGNGNSFVAYLFAHNNNDGEFGPDQNADIIKCGTYAGNGTDARTIDLGFEAQWVLVKRSDGATDWWVLDNMRGLHARQIASNYLEANTSNAEASQGNFFADSQGFMVDAGDYNSSGENYIYMAIRRGPLAVPTAATQVFSVATYSSNGNSNIFNTGFNVDMAITTRTSGTNRYNLARLMGSKYLITEANNAEGDLGTQWYARNNSVDFSTSFWGTTSDTVSWSWARARGYFDVVCYTGTGSARTIAHNLGVAPEMMWVKCRDGPGGSGTAAWVVYHKDSDASAPQDKYLYLDTSGGVGDFTGYWNDTAPTSTVFTLGTGNGNDTNASGQKYIAYLFATLPGISKVGSYTGSSSSVNVDCGFTSGARFILIKRSSASGDGWFTFDSVRGIVAGNDPFLYLNDTQGEFTSYDAIDPYSAGFTVTTALGGLNTNGSTYVFYAIAQ
jgi:hypothetical protein